MEKKKVSQDFLFKYITDHGVNISTLAELMGMSATMINGCFRHNKDANGNPRNFPERTLPKLNEALGELAGQMRCSLITFGSDQTFTNRRGMANDPACVEQINGLHRYFKMTQFLKYVLGWSQNKKSIILHTPSSKGYARISRDDVDRINAEILAVAGMLDFIEVTADAETSK